MKLFKNLLLIFVLCIKAESAELPEPIVKKAPQYSIHVDGIKRLIANIENKSSERDQCQDQESSEQEDQDISIHRKRSLKEAIRNCRIITDQKDLRAILDKTLKGIYDKREDNVLQFMAWYKIVIYEIEKGLINCCVKDLKIESLVANEVSDDKNEVEEIVYLSSFDPSLFEKLKFQSQREKFRIKDIWDELFPIRCKKLDLSNKGWGDNEIEEALKYIKGEVSTANPSIFGMIDKFLEKYKWNLDFIEVEKETILGPNDDFIGLTKKLVELSAQSKMYLSTMELTIDLASDKDTARKTIRLFKVFRDNLEDLRHKLTMIKVLVKFREIDLRGNKLTSKGIKSVINFAQEDSYIEKVFLSKRGLNKKALRSLKCSKLQWV